ncbi:hypothetical protein UA08_07046 [Talaromyces atroroseus]|uniref:Methyltransferase type 11 domain-containing protein n=1 Tax=Talaromyces atroroseus TaxID=1441469 RepID=A0A225AH15_TALAT|nr:hypothetical protein UA08_07046 [Talaromyces atroroseus]OKL57424.1 hypothetical protein UA08_07046 [Talaromyces atroroseus]
MENSDTPPTFLEFLSGLIDPAVLMCWSLKSDFIPVTYTHTLLTIFIRGQILAPILQSRQVRDEAFSRFWINFSAPRVTVDEHGVPDTSNLSGSGALIPPLLQKIRGVVLDVGPGTGTQMPYFIQPAKENVSAIYGAEPCVGLHAELRERAALCGLEAKYHILSCSADKKELIDALRRDGVQVNNAATNANKEKEKGIFDTMICIRVLCSVPNPAETISDLYSLLRPGGQMIIVEHVVNPFTLFGSKKGGSLMARCLQTVYSLLGWSFLIGDCCLDRDTETYLRNAAERDGGWESFDLEHRFAWTTLPYISGVLVKRQ